MNGAIAGVITTLLSQPFDTVKTRSQSAKATTTMQAVRSVLAEDGVRGFWKGTVMRLSRTVFSGGKLPFLLSSLKVTTLRNEIENSNRNLVHDR